MLDNVMGEGILSHCLSWHPSKSTKYRAHMHTYVWELLAS